MKLRVSIVRRRSGAAIIAAAALAALCAAVATDAARAQDSGSADSGWEKVDSVLVVPRVYHPDAQSQTDSCAEDCPDVSDDASGETPANDPADSEAGTADNPSGAASAASEAASDDWEQQATSQSQSNDGDDPTADGADSTLGSVEEYQEQQAMAEALGANGAIPMAPVIIAAPASPYYYEPGYAGSAASVVRIPLPSPLASSPTWMPPPMTRPSIVARGVVGIAAGFPGGFARGFRGGFGFHGGFGHR